MDYTKQPKTMVRQQSQKEPTQTIVYVGRAADDQYARDFGKRPAVIHCQAITADRRTQGYPVAPRRVKFYVRHPNNITVFATVGPEVTWDGWLFHREVTDRWIAGKDPGTWIIPLPLRPMSSFNPLLAS